MKRIAVLRGGPSDEYAVSMLSGQAVLEALRETNYITKDIVITKKGTWLDSGFERQPDAALEGVDVVFIALHGAFGEDGQLQRLLHRKHIPYTGSSALASALAFNKAAAKRALMQHGVKMPLHIVLKGEGLWNVQSEIDNIFNHLGTDLFIKPIASGSSVGARKIANQPDLEEALDELLPLYGEVLIEERIQGREATVGILEDFRNERHYVLPPVEIIPPTDAHFFDQKVKYDGTTTELCPGNFSYDEKLSLADIAVRAHKALGCTQYSRTDFIVGNDGIYFLEVNTLPGLTKESLFPKAADAVGLSFNNLVLHLVDTAKV